MPRRRKNGPVITRVESVGERKRLGRPVRDATSDLSMPLTGADIKRAQQKRMGYEVDEPENFSECVLATCLSKVAGAEVLIMRKHAFLALPGDEHTTRYEVDPATTALIHLNDEGRFEEIPPNIIVRFRPPAPSRRLTKMRSNAKAKDHYRTTRGTARSQRPVDPYRGVWRNGQNAAES